MNFTQWQEENNKIMQLIPHAEDFPLINNYGWEWETDGVTYNVRHVLNSYGCDVDYWLFLDTSKIGTKGCSKTFDNFNEAYEYLKTRKW